MGEEVFELFDKLIAESKENNPDKVVEIKEEIKKIETEEADLETEYYKCLRNQDHEAKNTIMSKRKNLNDELQKFRSALNTLEIPKGQIKHITSKKQILQGSIIFIPGLMYILFTCITSWLEINKY